MPHRTVYFDLTDTADERFDRVIETLIGVLLLFAPLAAGAVQAWSEAVVCVLAAAMAAVLGIKLIRRPDLPFIWSWTYLPIAIYLLLGVVQIIPLPLGVIRAVAPHTYEVKSSLLELAGAAPSAMTLSFYPEATNQNLRVLVAIATVYVVALNVIRRREQVQRMMGAIAAIGALVAVIAMVHLGFQTNRIYGLFGEPNLQWTTGPFVSRNHFGQFMNMTLGAAAGLLLAAVDELNRTRRRGRGSGNEITSVWLLGTAVTLIGVGVFLSLSRGAILSLAGAAIVAVVIAWRRGISSQLWLFLPLLWVVSVVVIFLGFDLLARRFVQAIEPDGAVVGGRLTILEDIAAAAKDAPIFGHGLGSFETVYPMLDSSSSATLATHAENEYAQALFEGGAVGLAMVLLFLVMVLRGYSKSLKSIRSPMTMPALALGAGVIAVALQSLTDFGQHIPANSLSTAVVIAMLLNLATAAGLTTADSPGRGRSKPGVRAAGLVTTGVVLGLAIADAASAARAEWQWFGARATHRSLSQRQWQGDNDEYAQLLTAASTASAQRPGDVQYRYWLNFYRFRSISRERDSAGRVLFDAELLQWSREIADELRAGAKLCPTYGPNFSLAGQIELNILDQPGGEKLVRRGFELSRIDPAATFEVAMLDARSGDWDAAMQKFERATDLLEAYRLEGAMALASMKRTDLAMKLAGGNVDVVHRIMGVAAQAGDPEGAAAIKVHLAEMVRTRATNPDATAQELVAGANQAIADNDPAAAVTYLERALLIDPTRPQWRLLLSRTLASTGDMPRAIREAQIAQRNNAPGAEALIMELRSRPQTRPGAIVPAATQPATRSVR